MTYDIAVSAGFFFIARDPSLLGLSKKVTSVTTYGVNFVQAEIETAAELTEPNFLENIKSAVDTLGIKWALHGEIGINMALETALEQYWKLSHRRMHQYFDILYETFIETGNRKYRPRFIDFHVSNTPMIGFIAEKFKFAGLITVDFEGRSDWSDLLNSEPKLKKWFIGTVLYPVLGREVPTWRGKDYREEVIRRHLVKNLKVKTDEELEKAEKKLSEEEKEEILYQDWLAGTTTRIGRGVINVEEIAYTVVAKYLELKKGDSKEPLWKLFFGNQTLEDLEKKWGKPLFSSDKGEFYLDPELTAMIACRYIMGHFKAPPIREYISEVSRRTKIKPFHKLSASEKLNQLNIDIVFENPEAEREIEGLHRIIRAKHMFNLVKAISHQNVRLLIDFEHYVHNGFDPIKEIRAAGPDFGRYVKACHVYAPVSLHEHKPIHIGSEDQRIVYSYLFELRRAGFMEGVLVFERGGGKDPGEYVSTSVEALKMIVNQLEKDTPPNQLPVEFFGVSPQGVLSPQRQQVIIREHALDPLKGMLSVPEEEYTFLSSEAIKKGKKPEEWKKEEYR